jgi:Cd2+/Zn2+-exporting ATPase
MASAIVDYARRHGAEPNGEVVDFTILVGEGVSGKVDGYEICIGNERMADRLQWTEGNISPELMCSFEILFNKIV